MSAPEDPLSLEQELWLEQVLSPQDDSARDSDLDDHQSFLVQAKADLEQVSDGELSPVAEGALVGRILNASTREDLSWRGELRLVGSYLHNRLRESVLLRVVAASLVLHLAAIPAVAFWVSRPPAKPPLRFGVELPIEELAEEESLEEPGSSEQERGLHAAEIDNALRRARFVLSRAQGPALPAVQLEDSLERKLLIGRSAFLQDRSWEAWWNETNQWNSASALARILWIELLLDAYVLEDRTSTQLGLCLVELEAGQPTDALETPLASLRSQLLRRSQAYGLRPAAPDFDAALVGEPLGQAWLETLRAAAAGSQLSEILDASAFGGWITR
jgi:hypothetical protein